MVEPWSALPRRIAVISVHTSPLAQPGTGDAGGMNVYVWQTAVRLAQRGVQVEIFTWATSSTDEPVVRAAPASWCAMCQPVPSRVWTKPTCPPSCAVFPRGSSGRGRPRDRPLRPCPPHYWLSGQVGWLAANRWGVPLVHTAHTLAAVKNASLADGDTEEPRLRIIGEQQVVDVADRPRRQHRHRGRRVGSDVSRRPRQDRRRRTRC